MCVFVYAYVCMYNYVIMCVCVCVLRSVFYLCEFVYVLYVFVGAVVCF